MEKGQELKASALESMCTDIHESLLKEPLDYMFADHFRQRALCILLDEIADGGHLDKKTSEAILAFLTSQMHLHILDEETGLFPLLRQRAEPEDEIEKVLRQLTEEHVSDGQDAKVIISALKQLSSVKEESFLDEKTAELFKRFAANERQHLIVENSIVLPLARVRLTEDDCAVLTKNMAARRDVVFDD